MGLRADPSLPRMRCFAMKMHVCPVGTPERALVSLRQFYYVLAIQDNHAHNRHFLSVALSGFKRAH